MRSRWTVVAVAGLLGFGAVWAMTTGDDGSPRGAGGSGAPSAGGSAAGAGRGAALPPDGRTVPADVTWTDVVEVDAGGGHVGPWRMNRSDWRYVDDPTVALDDAGRPAVAWVDQGRKDVLFRRYGPEGEPAREAPVDVSRSPDVFSWLPRVALAPDDPDRIYVLWQEIVFSGGTHGGEAFFARSTNGGRSFGQPTNLSNTEAGVGKGRMGPRRWHNGSLDLAAGPDGRVVAAWTAYEGGLWVSRSTDGGQTFADPVRVTAAGENADAGTAESAAGDAAASGGSGDGSHEPARAPSLAMAPDGTVHVAWAVGDDPEADLRHAVSEDGGRSFGDPRRLFPGGGHADAPKLAVDGEGTLHLAWAESPAGRVGAHRVLYARAPAGDGFGAAREVSGEHGERFGSVRFPSLALDGEGDPHLVWEIHPGRGDRSRGLGFTASSDGGDAFAEPTVVPGTDDPGYRVNGSLQGLLMRKLAVNRAGEVAVVNSSFEPGEASRVRLILGRPAPPE